MSKLIFYRQGKNRPTVAPAQLQHNTNFTEATAAETSHDLVCTFIEVSALYRFCYKPNLTVLKSCMMLSRSLIIVLCFGRDLFPRVSLHEDLHTNSTHCMQIILKTRFQFPRWVMKKVLFLKVSQYSNLFTFRGLKWNKLFVDFALLTSRRKQELSPFPGTCATRWDNLSTPPTDGETIRGRPG